MKEGLIALWLAVTFELFRQNIIVSLAFLPKVVSQTDSLNNPISILYYGYG